MTFAAAKALYAMHDPAGENWLVDVYNGEEKAKSPLLRAQMRKFMGNFHSFESAGTFLVTSGSGMFRCRVWELGFPRRWGC